MPKVHFILQAVSAEELPALFALRTLAMQESARRLEALHGTAQELQRVQQAFLASTRWQDLSHVVHNGQACGFIGWHAEENGWRLQHFYLHPQHQGYGLGSAVLKHLCWQADVARQAIRVAVLRASRAHAFYQRFAFQRYAASEWDIDYVRMPQAMENVD